MIYITQQEPMQYKSRQNWCTPYWYCPVSAYRAASICSATVRMLGIWHKVMFIIFQFIWGNIFYFSDTNFFLDFWILLLVLFEVDWMLNISEEPDFYSSLPNIWSPPPFDLSFYAPTFSHISRYLISWDFSLQDNSLVEISSWLFFHPCTFQLFSFDTICSYRNIYDTVKCCHSVKIKFKIFRFFITFHFVCYKNPWHSLNRIRILWMQTKMNLTC